MTLEDNLVLDKIAAWMMTRLQFYDMLSRSPCRTVLAFLISRNCEVNVSRTCKVPCNDSNRKLVKIPPHKCHSSSFIHEVFHTQKCSKDLMFIEGIEDLCHFVSSDKDYRKSALANSCWGSHGQDFPSY